MDGIAYCVAWSERGEPCEWRRRAYELVLRHLRECVLPVCPGTIYTECYRDGADGVTNRSRMRNALARQVREPVLAILDADCLVEPDYYLQALRLLNQRRCFVLPEGLYRWGPEATRRILDAGAIPQEAPGRAGVSGKYVPVVAGSKEQGQYRKDAVGGLLIVAREGWRTAGGYDERMSGWGGEDNAINTALDATWGPMRHVPLPLHHLYHPTTKGEERPMGARLALREFRLARGSRAAVKALLRHRGSYAD